MTRPQQNDRAIAAWLTIVYLLILAMIALGGITRLTESGLSIVKWEPILGILPPLTGAQWNERYEAYKAATGQAAALFPDLTVQQFKPLFFWEYFHRLVGRLMGMAVAIPLIIFLVRRRLQPRLAIKIILALIFGALQGGIGWLMVATGLQKDATHVSHYALAAHLTMALALMSYIVWLILDLRPVPETRPAPRWLRRAALAFTILLTLQIIYGAFTAGLRAGHFFNTFPTMNGYWLPPYTFTPTPLQALLSNPMAVQWTHRLLAWLLGFAAIAIWAAAQKASLSPAQRNPVHWLAALTLAQFGLGVAVILLNVPVWLGTLHQLNAALLLTAAIAILHRAPSAGKLAPKCR